MFKFPKFKVFGKLRDWGSRPGTVGVLAAGLVVGAILFGSLGSFMVYANSEPFCATSCHEMGTLKKEFTGTIHDTNRTGVRATCNDCHVPHEYIPNYLAKLGLFSDMWGHYVTGSIDTKEKFEAKRMTLATHEWDRMKASNSQECRNCHSFDAMSAELQKQTPYKKHMKAREEGKTCIDCHKGIAHNLPKEYKDPDE